MTMNEIRARRILLNINDNMEEMYNVIAQAKANFIINAIKANKAREIYAAAIKRVNFYNHLRASIKSKYKEAGLGMNLKGIFDFEDFIKFFE